MRVKRHGGGVPFGSLTPPDGDPMPKPGALRRLSVVKTQRSLDAATARKLAVAASTDPRTIQRTWRGEVVRGLAGERARAALAEAGLLDRGVEAPPAAAPVQGQKRKLSPPDAQ